LFADRTSCPGWWANQFRRRPSSWSSATGRCLAGAVQGGDAVGEPFAGAGPPSGPTGESGGCEEEGGCGAVPHMNHRRAARVGLQSCMFPRRPLEMSLVTQVSFPCAAGCESEPGRTPRRRTRMRQTILNGRIRADNEANGAANSGCPVAYHPPASRSSGRKSGKTSSCWPGS